MTAPRKIGAFAAGTVLAVAAAAFCLGFYVLPGAMGPASLWQRMCRAAGIVTKVDRSEARQSVLPAYTTVVMPRAAMTPGSAEQIGHGATLALRCTGCHGARGLSRADAPNLAGQYSEVVYKQLVDFQRGARVDAVMGAMVSTLSEQDMLDLSHYYAYLSRAEADHPLTDAPALVRVGDPMRSIAPCASCHGRADGKAGAPALDGEPKAYLNAQLAAFANGTRRNDANAVMRGEARLMTSSEMRLVTDHYASRSEEPTP